MQENDVNTTEDTSSKLNSKQTELSLKTSTLKISLAVSAKYLSNHSCLECHSSQINKGISSRYSDISKTFEERIFLGYKQFLF